MTAGIVNHLWQSTLFACAAWALASIMRHAPARQRYWIWLAASVKFLIPFSLLIWVGGQLGMRPDLPKAAQTILVVTQSVAAPMSDAAKVAHVDILPVVFAVWACISVALLMRWVLNMIAVARIAQRAVPLEVPAPVEARSTPLFTEPAVVGIFRPLLLLPEGIVSQLTSAQLQAVLAHEICHIRRRDNLTATLHMFVETLFWFHPMVWWIGARLVDERESACDAAVVQQGNAREVYAEAILNVCRLYAPSSLACVAGVSGSNLKQRIEDIMRSPLIEKRSLTTVAVLCVLAFAAVSTPIALGMARSAPTKERSNLLMAVKVFNGETLIASPRFVGAYGQSTAMAFGTPGPGGAPGWKLEFTFEPTDAGADRVDMHFSMEATPLGDESKEDEGRYEIDQHVLLPLSVEGSPNEIRIFSNGEGVPAPNSIKGLSVVLTAQRTPS